MSDSAALVPIEGHIRSADPPDETVLIVRGGPLTADKLVEHARRQMIRFSLRGVPMASVSADGTVGGWTLERLLSERLWSRSSYATVDVGTIRSAGYELLATFAAPHFDIVLPEPSPAAAGSLLALFSVPERNPYRRRR